MYIQKTYIYGDYKEVNKHYPGNYGAPGVKRGNKRKRTPEDIVRQNHRNKVKKVQRLILANFNEGSWHVTLGYAKDCRPPDMKTAKRQISRFCRDVRKEMKKAGISFKWIRVTEQGSRGGWHHHMIVEDIHFNGVDTKKLFMKYWTYGRCFYSPLYEEGGYEQLAEYLVKKDKNVTGESCTGATYSRSRNLILPVEKQEMIHRKRWRKEPLPEKGYYIVKDSVYNGENPVTGYPYQHYTMKRINNGGGT